MRPQDLGRHGHRAVPDHGVEVAGREDAGHTKGTARIVDVDPDDAAPAAYTERTKQILERIHTDVTGELRDPREETRNLDVANPLSDVAHGRALSRCSARARAAGRARRVPGWTLVATTSSTPLRFLSITACEFGHVESVCGKSEPHMNVSAPISSRFDARRSMSSMNVSQTCRFTYSLGFIKSCTSIMAPNFSLPWSIRCIQCGNHPMSLSAATTCRPREAFEHASLHELADRPLDLRGSSACSAPPPP